jgi:dipeptidase E
MPGQAYLDYPKKEIAEFLGKEPVQILFVPFAAVTFSYDEYENKVNDRLYEIAHEIIGVHRFQDKIKAVEEAEAIIVGGGNTWQLVRMLHDLQLMPAIRKKVLAGTPYIGWSAGANIVCPTLRTTNDMPITDPNGFDCLGLVPFQINPHYLDANPEGHGGETREQRIAEFLKVNPDVPVVGLREGTMLKLENGRLNLIGSRTARIFKKGETPYELKAGDDFSFLV